MFIHTYDITFSLLIESKCAKVKQNVNTQSESSLGENTFKPFIETELAKRTPLG